MTKEPRIFELPSSVEIGQTFTITATSQGYKIIQPAELKIIPRETPYSRFMKKIKSGLFKIFP